MTGPEAKRMIVLGTIGTGVLTGVAQLRAGKVPSARVGVGVIASGVILAAVAEGAPTLAGAFAALMLVTAAFVAGGGAWAGISAITAPTKIG